MLRLSREPPRVSCASVWMWDSRHDWDSVVDGEPVQAEASDRELSTEYFHRFGGGAGRVEAQEEAGVEASGFVQEDPEDAENGRHEFVEVEHHEDEWVVEEVEDSGCPGGLRVDGVALGAGELEEEELQHDELEVEEGWEELGFAGQLDDWDPETGFGCGSGEPKGDGSLVYDDGEAPEFGDHEAGGLQDEEPGLERGWAESGIENQWDEGGGEVGTGFVSGQGELLEAEDSPGWE